MKFYDRKKEIEILRRNWEKSAKHSLFTVMIGRRRIGKTLLLLKTEQEQKCFACVFIPLLPIMQLG
ncbi:hypothetical protein [Segatella copri]|jgi:AAA+ ATPase superfamily predicted ATPase|uniref:hypothetical protein n=1 Tax=Segatella copri TaxID=165179 RepID=UPI002580F10F|nr:hypothetical protein [Segatella copri]MEE1359722.1 hypothetical protein [Segatella copri]